MIYLFRFYYWVLLQRKCTYSMCKYTIKQRYSNNSIMKKNYQILINQLIKIKFK